MPRILGVEKNELRLMDNLSGSEIVLYYRNPTTQERAGYMNDTVRREGNKVKTLFAETRAKYGPKILIGFREGDFLVQEMGEAVAFSSDPSSPVFRTDWKEILKREAGDLLDILALQVFENSARLAEKVESVADEPIEAEDAEKN